MGMMNPQYHAPLRAPINLGLLLRKSVIEVADHNYDIVAGKLSKTLKKQNPMKAWGPEDMFSETGCSTHRLEGYVPKSEIIPSRPPPAECSAEDQPFFYLRTLMIHKLMSILLQVHFHTLPLKCLIMRLLIGRLP